MKLLKARYDADVGGWQTTRSSIIAAAARMTAGARITAESRAAMDALCKDYWPPVYAFVRRSGHSRDDAKDLVQSFFTRIFERNCLASVDLRRGRFRSWLLGALRHFLAKERRNACTWKRGGRSVVLSIDADDAEERYVHEPIDLYTPERLYERRWALTVLERAMLRLEQEHAKRNRRERFERLRGFLVGDEPSYKALADQSGEAEGTLRLQVKRLRDRYGELVRAEIRKTVPRSTDVDDELQHLYAALS